MKRLYPEHSPIPRRYFIVTTVALFVILLNVAGSAMQWQRELEASMGWSPLESYTEFEPPTNGAPNDRFDAASR